MFECESCKCLCIDEEGNVYCSAMTCPYDDEDLDEEQEDI